MSASGNKSQRPTNGTRTAVLDAVRRSEQPVTVQEIAEELNLHTNSVRFHLSRLLQTGVLREGQADPDGPGRPRMVYTAVPVPPAEAGPGAPSGESGAATAAAPGPSDPAPASDSAAAPGSAAPPEGQGYQFLAEMLAGHLAATSPDPQATASAVGEAWGRYLADKPVPFARSTEDEAIAQVTEVLDRAGFSPVPREDGYRLDLLTCPFRAVADHQPGVVCSVHLGLMRGVLDELNAPVEVVGLDRFDAPYPCVARLHAIGGGPGDGSASSDAEEADAEAEAEDEANADDAVHSLPGWARHIAD